MTLFLTPDKTVALFWSRPGSLLHGTATKSKKSIKAKLKRLGFFIVFSPVAELH